MKIKGLLLAFLLLLAPIAQAQTAVVLNINGGIGPAVADYIDRGMAVAAQEKAAAVVIQMDTPGGLDKSMRSIVKSILASPIPVITYVTPSGARAASAGTFILYASHVAAMAPGTNLGAASPVSIGGQLPTPDKDKKAKNNTSKMTQKVTKDAVAYIRSLAQLHGRNAKWAEKAVQEAETLTAKEAKQKNVIDVVAKDLPALLKNIANKTIKVNQQKIKMPLITQTKIVEPDWRFRFLTVLTDPAVAYMLLLLGIYGLFFEFTNPGLAVPGVAGAIAIILALYALALLPVSYAGLGLLLLGIIFIVMEAFMPSFGVLGIGGIIAFVLGSILLFDKDASGLAIGWQVIAAMAVINAGFFFFVAGMALKARQRKIVAGQESLIGLVAEVTDKKGDLYQVKLGGELWQARCAVNLEKKQRVRVVAVDGITLQVELLQGE